MAYESLKYKVLLKEKQFEIREYESFVSMGVSNGYGGGFSKLFNYITGYNNRSQKIAMHDSGYYKYKKTRYEIYYA